MSLRDLLVHVDHGKDGIARLRLAADLAARHRARLTALHVREPSQAQAHRLKTAELGLVPGSEAGALAREIETALDADAAALQALLSGLQHSLALDVAWRSVSGHAARLVTQRSRYADLTIVGQNSTPSEDLPDEYSFAETMLFTSGRPVLMTPQAAAPGGAGQPSLGRRIAIGWNASRPAARALADSIPLIERADSVIVLAVDPERFEHPERPTLLCIVDHLRLHCSKVEVCMAQSGSQSICDVLQTEALVRGADLLIAGAYSHPKLWEKMLGGVTRDLLLHMRLPVLMAH